jgi:hypothetical protein
MLSVDCKSSYRISTHTKMLHKNYHRIFETQTKTHVRDQVSVSQVVVNGYMSVWRLYLVLHKIMHNVRD